MTRYWISIWVGNLSNTYVVQVREKESKRRFHRILCMPIADQINNIFIHIYINRVLDKVLSYYNHPATFCIPICI